jgi:hypothetical protein
MTAENEAKKSVAWRLSIATNPTKLIALTIGLVLASVA